ncbi:tripartite tricarboxylate transporter substrate binding protein [Oceanicella sp. SM1341]|uniref:Bug family tripartite tricarboxylate transporter substrate binding protein n=1 Tax=Oceanicella sp. SM1341 TaxID=1548889 RepID=UPI000E47A177|nr:tripartite tricarboxylate transporter substrate binding protein [Oceanicella sp. SM1341]
MRNWTGAGRRRFVARLAAAMSLTGLVGAATLAPTGRAAAAEDWPDSPITIVVPFNAGGSADRMARTLADPMSKILGQPVVVENRPGGAGGLGATWVARQDPDGNTLLLMQATPYLANAILTGGAPVKWEDFRLLNAQWNDYGIVAVHKDSPYQSLAELIDAMKEPGRVSTGVVYANGGHMQTLVMMQALDIPFDNLRFVTYDGGSPLRAALAGNQVDFEIIAAEGARSIMDNLRVLAVVNDSDPDSLGAPLLNDAMAELGAGKQPIIGGNVTGLMVPAAFEQEYPERYAKLLDAYRQVVESPEYAEAAKSAGVGADWVGPEESQAMVDEAYEALSSHADLVN